MSGQLGVSVHLMVHETPKGRYVKATVCSTQTGRYRSELVVIMGTLEALPQDPEELIAVALSAVHAAVYHS